MTPDIVVDLVLVHHDEVTTEKLDGFIFVSSEFGFVEVSLVQHVRHVGHVAQVTGDVQVDRLVLVLTKSEHTFLKY